MLSFRPLQIAISLVLVLISAATTSLSTPLLASPNVTSRETKSEVAHLSTTLTGVEAGKTETAGTSNITRVSSASDRTRWNSVSYPPPISANGRYVALAAYMLTLPLSKTNTAVYRMSNLAVITGTTNTISSRIDAGSYNDLIAADSSTDRGYVSRSSSNVLPMISSLTNATITEVITRVTWASPTFSSVSASPHSRAYVKVTWQAP